MRALTLLALLSCTAASAVAAEPTPSFDGSWWGLLDTGTIKLHLAFKLRHEKGGWTGEVTSTDQHSPWIPLSSVTVAGDTIKIDISALHASYEGKRTDQDHVTGTFTQGMTLRLELLRGDVPITKHPQEPKPPFPYASEDVTVDNKAASLALGCTLTHPSAPKFPVVIFITGSGQQDRDENILGQKPFLLLADALARQGIGALRCDNRGGNHSTGNFATATTFDFAGDVEAELAWVKARPDVDGKHIGLIGHSEGGTIAPIVAARRKDVAFLVLLAGIGMRGEEVIVRQSREVARSAGLDAKQAAAAEAQEKQVVAVVMREKDDAATMQQLKALLHQTGAVPVGPAADAALEQKLKPVLSPWYRTFLALDPRLYLQQVKVPVLALNGERDIQVPVENLQLIRQALAGDKDVTVKPLPGLNHLFQRCKECNVGEYGLLEETMSPTVVQLVVEWVQKHAR